jgi:hypothetical protein
MSDNETWAGDVYRPKAQRAAILSFADAIGARRKLGADEAGNPRIEGKHGRVYVKPTTTEAGSSPIFQLYVFGGPQRIRHARPALAFARVVGQGDEDMICETALLDITPHRGEVIRDKLGLAKRFEFDEATLARKRESMAAMRAKLPEAA